jgi:ubiquinone/menaquinone biosynthesis C-methylase UbiE
VGVDISEEMVAQAQRLNGDLPNCRFVVNADPDLRAFDDGQFDLVYCRLVLQHIRQAEVTDIYIPELVRVLRPGGLLWFQLPTMLPRRYRMGLRRRAYRALRRLGVPAGFVYRGLRLQPMRMTAIPEAEVRALLSAVGAHVLEVHSRRRGAGVQSAVYAATRS